MMNDKHTILLLTDFSYQAKGREYFREDLNLSCFLRRYFEVCICHIHDIQKIINYVDAVLLRNTGPQISHCRQLKELRDKKELVIFNDLMGKGDINGKYHLIELYKEGFPVIPSFSSINEIVKKFPSDRYLVKPVDGADSSGVVILGHGDLLKMNLQNSLVQPLIDFEYEVSFYFIGNQFHYALYAPNTEHRWNLKPYEATERDIDFARQFIQWNSCKFGIQRVDACRTKEGKLLLMELEDYNPFLSLDILKDDIKERFLNSICMTLLEMISIKNHKLNDLSGSAV